jgi:hypothetical protein
MDLTISIDAYLAALEERLPEFTWNATTFGKGRPVFLSWSHRHPVYAPMETQRMMVRGGTFASLPEALRQVVARYDGFEAVIRRDREKKTQEWERMKARMREAAQQKLDAKKPEPEVEEEVEADEAEAREATASAPLAAGPRR